MMLGRKKNYGLFAAFSITILLILVGSKYMHKTYYLSIPEYRKTTSFKNTITTDMKELHPTVNKILQITKTEIVKELQNYNFTYPRVHHLEDLVPESGGQPLRSLIITSWRSGSNFLGEIVNAVPGNFYHYEPFAHYESTQVRGALNVNKALATMRNRFNCNFDGMEDFFKFVRIHTAFIKANTRLWNKCHSKTSNKHLCINANFTATFCKLFPFQSMKVVRVRLRVVEDLLQDEQLNVKVVFMVRDPRGVMRSRHNTEFCSESPDCSEPEFLCADMISDYVAARRLFKKYPDRLMVLRYEELALHPFETTQRLYAFLGLSLTPQVGMFLITHTTKEERGTFSTHKVSSDVPYKWKTKLPYEYVAKVQFACQDAMDLWGYRMAYNASHMASKEFNPVGNYTFW